MINQFKLAIAVALVIAIAAAVGFVYFVFVNPSAIESIGRATFVGTIL
ncbi:hypothetical protein [Lacisediminihabitans profunda]|nr:hypothetical protein [Lacisediminihabitans profunda]